MGVNILIAVAIVIDVLCLVVCIGAVVKDIKRWGKILSIEYEDEEELEEPVASVVCFEKLNKKHAKEAKGRVIPFAQ